MHVFVWVCACVLRHKLSCCNVLSVWLLIKAEICGLVSIAPSLPPSSLPPTFVSIFSAAAQLPRPFTGFFFFFWAAAFRLFASLAASINSRHTFVKANGVGTCLGSRSGERWRGKGRGLSGKCCNMYTTRRTLSTVLPTSSATATATEATYLSNAKRQPEIY